MIWYKRENKIQMIISDLDDTLLMPDKGISEGTKRVFAQCKRQGILTGFATARLLISTKEEAEVLRPDVRLVSNGAVAAEGEKLLFYEGLEEKPTDKFLCDLQEMGADRILVGAKECAYTNKRTQTGTFARRTAVLHDFRKPLPEQACQIFFRLREPGQETYLRNTYPHLNWIIYRGGSCCVTAKGVSKASGLLRLAELYGIEMKRIAAFGDDQGDCEMLRQCGMGVAVENALPCARQAAAYLTRSNAQDGVAWFVEQRILGGACAEEN